MAKQRYIDTHAHLNLGAFAKDADAVADRCAGEEVAVVNVGTTQASSKRAVALATRHEHCYAIIGLHPTEATPKPAALGEQSSPVTFNPEPYRALAEQPKVVGVGECGFDYYHNASRHAYQAQEAAFIAQIQLANELRLPLMIHTRAPKPGTVSPTGRSVYQDVYEVLKQYARVPFNVHFYAGTYEEAKRFFDLGGTISFTGVITFAKEYAAVVKAAPLDLIHAETDCPYVTPVPYRGQRCEPWMVRSVVEKIATLKQLDKATVATQLKANASQQYGLNL